MTQRVEASGLQIDKHLSDFVEKEMLVGHPKLNAQSFWEGAAKIIAEFAPRNLALLKTRDELQAKLDQWHRKHPGANRGLEGEYREFLHSIGYLRDEPADFAVGTQNVDFEIAEQAGPQLVVPITNARYALNAANARWGSLYDALYGTDAIDRTGDLAPSKTYNPKRGEKVIAFAKRFLNDSIPLDGGVYEDAKRLFVKDGTFAAELKDGRVAGLRDPSLFAGYTGDPAEPRSVLFLHGGLHFDVLIDRSHPIGKQDPSGVKDVIMEAALTSIMDFEDSIAAVDGEDKALVYRNWLGLMKGDLTAEVSKDGKTFVRKLNPDREYKRPDGTPFKLGGRSLLFTRNVGHRMTTPAVLDASGAEAPEGVLDCIFTAAIAHFDLSRKENTNSRTGSVYVVKPKMHGPDEVEFSNDLFDACEDFAGLARNTLKIGVMDEEMRTSLNLKACIEKVKDRIVFINTGFLDRTGDEIHTLMECGPVERKAKMKQTAWLKAYELSNVQTGLACDLPGKAQIGKGMWAMPDLMAKMLAEKIGHPKAGATTAWVPSPTAATLHAIHYHQVDVKKVQAQLRRLPRRDYVEELLTKPVIEHPKWTDAEIREEIENNCQGILGYVARWVEQGVGCSKVPDIHNVALMEDRATCRISSQHVANWLHHGVVDAAMVEDALRKMAKVVDEQNKGDENYIPMCGRFEESCAFRAARDLIFKGVEEPSGYTEPTLHHWRLVFKAQGRA